MRILDDRLLENVGEFKVTDDGMVYKCIDKWEPMPNYTAVSVAIYDDDGGYMGTTTRLKKDGGDWFSV